MSDWNNLSERLKRLGVQLGISQPLQTNSEKNPPLEELVPGRTIATIFGEVFSLNHTYPEDRQHGHLPLKPLTDHHWLAQWAKAPATPDLRSLVFLDTETTGLSGGTGTMPFMIGAGRFIENQFVVEQFFVRNPAEETAQLAALSEFVEGVEGIVTYNGKAFDMPIINTRYIMQRLSNPFTAATHFDLLPYTRRIWKSRLGQCNLGNIERHVLGFEREQEDIPGYLVPDFYREYLFTGDATHMPGIFYHNEIDVLSLSALFSWLAAILEDPSDERFTDPGDLISVTRYRSPARDTWLSRFTRQIAFFNFLRQIVRRAFFYAQGFKNAGGTSRKPAHYGRKPRLEVHSKRLSSSQSFLNTRDVTMKLRFVLLIRLFVYAQTPPLRASFYTANPDLRLKS